MSRRLKRTGNRFKEQEADALKAQAKNLPLNRLPGWARAGVNAAAQEFNVDAIDLAAVFSLWYEADQCGHDETDQPDFERPSEAIGRGSFGGKEWVGQGALVK